MATKTVRMRGWGHYMEKKHLMLRVTDIGYSQTPAMNTAATYHICIERALRQGWASAVVSPAESQSPRKTSFV